MPPCLLSPQRYDTHAGKDRTAAVGPIDPLRNELPLKHGPERERNRDSERAREREIERERDRERESILYMRQKE